MSKRAIRDGLVAGVLAATVLAVLFYFYDLGRGTPLATPAFLLGTLLGRSGVEPTLAVVAGYTLLHYAAWAALGLLAAVLVEGLEVPRNVFIGAAYGLFACSLVFYGGLVIVGADVLAAPAWPAVFFGNALAGAAMFAWFHWTSSEPGVLGLRHFLDNHRVLRQGVVAGLIGAVTVALWFLVIDTLLREPLYTPAALGTILFRGGGGPAAVEIAAGPVIGYTLVHFAAFILFGEILSALAEQVERFPPLIFGVVILFVVFETFIIAMVAVLGSWVLEALAWWSVLVGNLLAAATMGGYLWRAHPAIREQLTDEALWSH